MCEWLLCDLQIPSLNYLKTEKNEQNFRQVIMKKNQVNTSCFLWKNEKYEIMKSLKQTIKIKK